MATILVVDDIPENRNLLSTLLSYRGHLVLEASDGREALELLKETQPDLVITDILMPTMDGYELVRRIRASMELFAVPVIFYTAYYHNAEALSLAHACGVSFVLTKPAEPQHILETVDRVLAGGGVPGLEQPGQFDREHLRLVTDKLSDTADQLHSANERLSALIDINLRLASERDMDALLQFVCTGARSIVGCRFAAVGVAPKTGTTGSYFKLSGIEPQVASLISEPDFDAGVFGTVVREKKTERFSKLNGDSRKLGFDENYPSTESAVVAPIVSLTRSYGWICLSDKIGSGEFSDEDEMLVTILASQVGRIYENGSLYNEIERQSNLLRIELSHRVEAEEKVRRLNRVHAVLSGINAVIVRAHSLNELFDDACQIAVKAGGFRYASISFIENEPTMIELKSWAAEDVEFGAKISEEFRKESTYHLVMHNSLVKNRGPIAVELIDKAVYLPMKEAMQEKGFRSLVNLPLVVSDQTIGLISLFSDQLKAFDEEEISLLRELAADVSFAVDHIEKEARLNYLAFYDARTGLANRMLFQERLTQYVSAESDNKGKLALILIDIDRYKQMSNLYERWVLDDILKQVGRRLTSCVASLNQIGFFGIDRFAILLPHLETEDEAARWIKQTMNLCFGTVFQLPDGELKVKASAGVALYPNDGESSDDLIKSADAAVVRARAEQEAYLFSTRQITSRVLEKMSLERKLHKALKNQEFVLHYQPKLDLNSNAINGVEALIRWNSPGTGLVPPIDFIPLLEETGLIVDVGTWALLHAAQTYRGWKERGISSPRIAVNLSTVQLRQRDFVQSLADIVTGAEADHGIDLEITESLSMDDIEDGISKLEQITRLGISIAIDDFGTGYSSLRYLSKMPIQLIKIDRSFVISMLKDPATMTLVSTMVTMAQSLGLKVVAEGVDSEDQLEALRRLKCDQIQGYLLSKALPAPELESFLLSYGR